jgi:hypothetical protein
MKRIFVDTLAGVKFPEVIAKLPRKYGTRYFYEEFGLAKAQIEKDIKSGREWIGVQGLWAGKTHNYTDAHRKRAIRIAVELEQISKELKKPIYYSPFCEHKKTSKYMLDLFSDIKKVAPSLILVNSPISGGQWVNNGYVDEIHHNDKPAGMPKGAYIFSMDGLHQPDCDIEIYKKRHLNDPNCIAFGVWALQHNCKRNAKDQTLAKARKCKPTVELNESLIFQIENDKKKVKLNKGWISKSHSEQHKDVDPRANKLVLVGPKGKSFKNVRIGDYKLADGGFTEDKRQTWRSTKWAYKMGRFTMVIADGELVGSVDFPFRQNEYREKT